MKLNKKTLIIIFVFIIVLNFLGYWGVWSCNPDYFIVQSETNVHPINALKKLLWDNDLHVSLPKDSRLDQLSSNADYLIDQMHDLNKQEEQLLIENVTLEAELKRLSSIMEANRARKIEQYRQEELKDLELAKTNLKKQITDMEFQFAKNPTIDNPLYITISDYRVKLAQQELKLAERRYEIADRIVREFGAFAKPEDFQSWKTVYDKITETMKEKNDLFDRRIKLRSEAYKLMTIWREERGNRLSFLDFLYFSFSVSTTTTFGDIIPNHTVPRVMVILQLILSIVIVGLFINELSRSHQ